MQTKKHIFRILLIENIMFEFGAGLYGPIYAIYTEKLGGSILTAGVAWAIFLLVLGVCGFATAKHMDKFSMKKMAIVTSILHAVFIFLYVFVSHVWQLFALQLLLGLVGAINFPAWDAWFTKTQDPNKQGSSFALMHGTNNIGRGLAALIGSSVAYFLGFKMLFLVSSIFVFLSTFLLVNLEEKV